MTDISNQFPLVHILDDGLENVSSSTFEAMIQAFTGKKISKTIRSTKSPYRALFPDSQDGSLTMEQCIALHSFLQELSTLSQIPHPIDPLSLMYGQNSNS